MPGIKIWLLSLLLHQTVQATQQNKANEHELWRRNLDAVDKLSWQQPQGIKKMSDDPGEKFWAHYWDLDEQHGNISTPDNPAMLHDSTRSLLGRMIFARDASCPTNYNPCTSLGHPDSCCPNGQICINVQDTGSGPVGCCTAGAICGNTISGCDASQGYTSCPNSTNKGCCIPGYVCAGNICLNANTQTVTASTSSTTSTTTTITQGVVVSVTTLTITNVNTSGFTTTATVTVTQSESGTAIAPVRPTSDGSTVAIAPASVTITTTSTSISTSTSTSMTISTMTTTSDAGAYCPTGFYMCSAVFLGGCCRVDRDCNTTSCPATASTTVIDGSPTVVAPTGASTNAPTCATGWYSCPASLGGNCCPSGYNCAQTNCPASISGVAAQNKETPNEATTIALAWLYILIASSAALGMVLL